MLIQHIALVCEAGGVMRAERVHLSAALRKQVDSHFGPRWGLAAASGGF
jgi:hypothetical protein